ncbi:MAG: tRNA (adenosine(37)-N6)-dimethylallyltransferase MiaA [Syntrophothermus sp.]
MKKPVLAIITGPTAVGKTSTSVWLARQLSTEIISADSRQFYREMRIGTAVPAPGEREGIPHHFIGHLSVADQYNVSRFEQDVLRLTEELFWKYPVVIMTGGSGLYIDAVCHGIDDLPDADATIRGELKHILQKDGIESLQQKLKLLDPVFYSEADIQNPNRILRALEVSIQTGLPYSSFRKRTRKERPFDILKIGIFREKEELNNRINHRVDQMVEDGLELEARNLLPFRHLNALNTVGYKEFFRYFDGETSFEQAVTDIKTNSRRYAKRQMTWFRKDPELNWIQADNTQKMLELITSRR